MKSKRKMEIEKGAFLARRAIEEMRESRKKPDPSLDDFPLTEVVPLGLRIGKKKSIAMGHYPFEFGGRTYYYYLSAHRIVVLMPTFAREYTMYKNWDRFIAKLLPEALSNYVQEELNRKADQVSDAIKSSKHLVALCNTILL